MAAEGDEIVDQLATLCAGSRQGGREIRTSRAGAAGACIRAARMTARLYLLALSLARLLLALGLGLGL
jgi:hypothetical protein